MQLDKAQAVLEAARRKIPGGVNSPVRAYKSVGGTPPHLASGSGAWVTDIDGNRYVDLVLAYGPLILGHAHPEVVAAVKDAAGRGLALGGPTAAELTLAEQITERVPGCEMVRLVNSGTEATMSALRLARAASGRDGMIKFAGCYHGHADSFLVAAGSGALTFGTPDSPGVPAALAELTFVADYNDLDSVRALFERHPERIGCLFVEPVAGNMGCVAPEPGFLEGLRELCDAHGALLVFDEVMTGFRVARGGWIERSGVRADLVTLGKVIGGGLPIGAYGGSRALMERIAPAGDVYQAGTLSGNPVAVAAGSTTLSILDRPGTYEALDAASARLARGLEAAGESAGVAVQTVQLGSMLGFFLAPEPVRGLADVTASDREAWTRFFHGMLERGVILPPSPYEAWFLSTAHDDEALEVLLDAARASLAAL